MLKKSKRKENVQRRDAKDLERARNRSLSQKIHEVIDSNESFIHENREVFNAPQSCFCVKL